MYDERDNMWFNMYWGVPQGGMLSPLFLILTLEYILMNKDKSIADIINEGKILAYADDIIITVNWKEKSKIEHLIKHLEKYELKTNSKKWYYIWNKEEQSISKLGIYSEKITYLGVTISNNK